MNMKVCLGLASDILMWKHLIIHASVAIYVVMYLFQKSKNSYESAALTKFALDSNYDKIGNFTLLYYFALV